MKRILALVLAVLMTLALGTAVFSAEETGTVTINNAVAGKTYELYRIFDLTYSGSAIAYTLNADWVDFFIGTGASGAEYLSTSAISGVNELTYNGTKYYINITESNKAAFAKDALIYVQTENLAAEKTATAESTSVAITGVALGYHLVYPKGATEIKSGEVAICSLDSSKPNATVNAKAAYPTIDKTVTQDGGYDIGDAVTYTITGKVPDTTGFTSYNYVVKDKMSSGLTFNSTVSEFTLTIGTAEIDTSDATNYATLEYDATTNGFTLTIDMTKYTKGDAVSIVYKAVVNEDAVNAKTVNGATLTYPNDPNDSTDTTTTTPVIKEIWTSKITIDKRATSATGSKLGGAKFVLMNASGAFYKQTVASSEVTDVDWVAVSGTGLSSTALSVTDAALTALKAAVTAGTITAMTTTSEGAAEFVGLKDGTYYLIEIEAPAGYNMLDSAVAATVDEIAVSSTDTTKMGEDEIATVVNKTGTTLPTTGGIGTQIFYVVGGIMVVAAFVLYVTKRRMSDND